MTALTDTTTFVRRYLHAHDPLDVSTLRACRHPGFEMHRPQIAERVTGDDVDMQIRTRDHSRATNSAPFSTPSPIGTPANAGWQLTGRDDVWIGQAVGTTVDGEPCHVVTVIELQAGLVRRETNWFAPSFPRPESRAELSELAEWRATGDVVEVAVTDDVAAARHRAIEAYFGELSTDPVATHEAFLHPDCVEIMPQSVERVLGRDRMIEVLLSHPNFPTVRLRRALVVGATGLGEVSMSEGDEEFFGIGIIHFRGAKADTITEYWAPRLDAPTWRNDRVQPLEV